MTMSGARRGPFPWVSYFKIMLAFTAAVLAFFFLLAVIAGDIDCCGQIWERSR